MHSDRKNYQLQLFDLSWEDVLFPKLAIFLSIKDCFNLRCCSKTSKHFVDSAFRFRKEINLSGNNSKNIDLAFNVLAENCYKLDRLCVANCKWLFDDLMLKLLSKNTRLKSVNLNGCTNLTPKSLQPIIIDCKQLRVLKLSQCDWLTAGSIDALTLHQNDIEELDISYSIVSEHSLAMFFQKLVKLTVLSMANSLSATDNVLIQIANSCKSLEHINLFGCVAITDNGIRALTLDCTNLKSLLVQRCPGVTERVLAPLRGRINIDRPTQSYNLPTFMQRLYLQV